MNNTGRKYLAFDFRVFTVIGIGSLILTAIVAPIELWAKFSLGYVAMAIISICFILGARDTWKEIRDDAYPLAKLRDEQKRNPGPYIHPIIIELEEGRDSSLNVSIAFISQLLFPLKLRQKIEGYLFVAHYEPKQKFEFDIFVGELHEAQISSPISQVIVLAAGLRENIAKIKGNGETPLIKLKLEIYPEGYDPITFDPSDTDPLKLSRRLI